MLHKLLPHVLPGVDAACAVGVLSLEKSEQKYHVKSHNLVDIVD